MNRCQTCLKLENGKRAKDSTEADPPTARSVQQRRPHSAERLCTATSEEETPFSRKTDQHKYTCVGRSRVQCKRESQEHTWREVACDSDSDTLACDSDSDSERNQTRETRIEDTSAVPNEPTDHAVARGRDVSLRHEGGHSSEHHTVVYTSGPREKGW